MENRKTALINPLAALKCCPEVMFPNVYKIN